MSILKHDEMRYPYSGGLGLHGDIKHIGKGALCCSEHDSPTEATYQVVTEADSFGCEYTYFCESCLSDYKAARVEQLADMECERCGGSTDVRERRDPEEGSGGPVYDMCGDCYRKIVEYLND